MASERIEITSRISHLDPVVRRDARNLGELARVALISTRTPKGFSSATTHAIFELSLNQLKGGDPVSHSFIRSAEIVTWTSVNGVRA